MRCTQGSSLSSHSNRIIAEPVIILLKDYQVRTGYPRKRQAPHPILRTVGDGTDTLLRRSTDRLPPLFRINSSKSSVKGRCSLTHSADIALIVTLAASFMIMLVGVVRCINHYCRCRRDIVRRIKALRIDKMLNHVGISRARYLRKAKSLTIEKHLLVCEDCGTTELCDECLEQGKHIPEYTFCRNYRGLIWYR